MNVFYQSSSVEPSPDKIQTRKILGISIFNPMIWLLAHTCNIEDSFKLINETALITVSLEKEKKIFVTLFDCFNQWVNLQNEVKFKRIKV